MITRVLLALLTVSHLSLWLCVYHLDDGMRKADDELEAHWNLANVILEHITGEGLREFLSVPKKPSP